jgi:hypothetical protein
METRPLAVVAALLLALLNGCVVRVDSVSPGHSPIHLTAVAERTETGKISAGIQALDVDNLHGRIRIIGTDDNDLSWGWTLTARAQDDAGANEAAQQANCTAHLEGDRLRIAVSLPDAGARYHFTSDLTIRAPRTISVRTTNQFGPIELSGIEGAADLDARHGSLDVRDVAGEVRARTSFASLTLHGTGPASLRNQNGEIHATDIRGALDAETSFASVTARHIAGPIKVRNRNGPVEVASAGTADLETSFARLGAREIDGPARLRNRNGPIELNGVAGNADAETSFADMRITGVAGDANLVNRNGRIAAREVTGAVNATTSFAAMEIAGSGPRFICENRNGAIRLRSTSPVIETIEARTSFETLEVRLSPSIPPVIEARTSFGPIESDFPLWMPAATDRDRTADLSPDAPRISLFNQNGAIRIIRN